MCYQDSENTAHLAQACPVSFLASKKAREGSPVDSGWHSKQETHSKDSGKVLGVGSGAGRGSHFIFIPPVCKLTNAHPT